MEPGPVREGLEDALIVHRQHRPGQPLTPHRHLRLRFRRLSGRRARVRVPWAGGGLLISDVAAVRSKDRARPPAGDRPLLSFLLGRGQLGLDAIRFLTQPVDSTASSCCSSSPTTDGIRNLPGGATTRHTTTPTESPTLCLTSENAALKFGTTTAPERKACGLLSGAWYRPNGGPSSVGKPPSPKPSTR